MTAVPCAHVSRPGDAADRRRKDKKDKKDKKDQKVKGKKEGKRRA